MEEEKNSAESRRKSSVSSKDTECKDVSLDPASPTSKVPKKFINNWRLACDRTKDRTKELLKKWRTLPEGAQADGASRGQSNENNSNWKEHVWNTWVTRSPSGELTEKQKSINMTEIQRKKFEHFFISYLDLDRDDAISLADFEAFAERLRHFSDWSKNSAEYHRLKEVLRGFIEAFLLPNDLDSPIHSYELLEKKIGKEQLSLQQWLEKWSLIINDSKSFFQLPLWLQYFPKILFKAMNTSGTGAITKEEMGAFFASVLGLSSIQLGSFTSEAHKVLTSVINGRQLTFWFLKQGIYKSTSCNLNLKFKQKFSLLGGLKVKNYCKKRKPRTFAWSVPAARRALMGIHEQPNNQHPLTYSVYRLSFANFIFGRYPNGPGLYILGPMSGVETSFFPIDYSALNSAPEDLEFYSPQVRSNRRSVIV